MQCPTCGEYGDLAVIKVKQTSERVLVCTECDSLWKTVDVQSLEETFLSVTDYFMEQRLAPDWSQLELLRRV